MINLSPIRNRLCYAINRNESVGSSVVGLDGVCCPATVFRGVAFVVVYSIYRQLSFWSWPHVFEKSLKRIPSLTNTYTSTSVVHIRNVGFGVAPGTHSLPRSILCFLSDIVFVIMRSLFFNAATTFRFTGCEMTSNNLGLFSAIAHTQPFAIFIGIGGSILGAVNSFAQAGSALADMSLRTGVAANVLSEYTLVAKLADTSMESLGNGFKKMQVFMVEAAKGSKENMSVLRDLGIPLRVAENVVFNRFATRLAGRNWTAFVRIPFVSRSVALEIFEGRDAAESRVQEEPEQPMLLAYNE